MLQLKNKQMVEHEKWYQIKILFNAMYPALIFFVRKLAGNEIDANKIIQDAFVRIWQDVATKYYVD